MTARKKPRPIPVFASREEAARWFDTHDMADYQAEFKPVPARFAKNLSTPMTIRLYPQTVTRLRALAHARGIGPTTLILMWILQRLQELKDASRVS